MIYKLNNGRLEVAISTLSAEVVSVKRINDQKDYMWDGHDYWLRHAPILFPFCGSVTNPYFYKGQRFDGEAKHGFINRTEFSAETISDTEIIFSTKDSEDTRTIYPFSFEFSVRYTLNGNTLHSEYSIKNCSDDEMPYMLGLHPGFNLFGDAPKEEFYVDLGKELTLKQHPLVAPFVSGESFDRFIERGRVYITNEIYDHGTIVLDDSPKKADLIGPDGKIVSLSFSDNFSHLCIWKWPDDEARYICIEPWSDLPSDGSSPDELETRNTSRLASGRSDTYFCDYTFC